MFTGKIGIVLLQNNLHCWFAKEFKDFGFFFFLRSILLSKAMSYPEI